MYAYSKCVIVMIRNSIRNTMSGMRRFSMLGREAATGQKRSPFPTAD
jgi:hypothetical protein